MPRYATLAPIGLPDYDAGADGVIYSRRSGRRVPMAAAPNPKGYLRVQIGGWAASRRRVLYVARTVLTAFRGPPPAEYAQQAVARYKDGNKANCRIGNLCWAPKRGPHGPGVGTRRAALARIRTLMRIYGITTAELE